MAATTVPLIIAMAIVMFPATVIPAFVMTVMMARLIARDVHLVVPAILNKIDPFAAGIIFSAVFAPIFCVTGWHMQVDWLSDCNPMNQARFPIYQAWLWVVADVDTAIEAGLTDIDGYIHIGRVCWRSGGDDECCCNE